MTDYKHHAAMKSNRWISSSALAKRAALLACLAPLANCSNDQQTLVQFPAQPHTSATLAPNAAPASAPSVKRADLPAAIFNDETISWEEIRPRILEMSGGQVLEELMLESVLRKKLESRKLIIDEAALALEEKAAVEALSSDPERAAQLLAALRDTQSLGSNRWTALLWRNAALRALAREEVTVTADTIRQAFDTAHGPRRIGRLIVVPDIAAAEAARSRLAAGETFQEVAAKLSIDSSAARGGLLPPIARLDPSFPPAFREALFRLDKGEVSSAILLDNGYAIVELREEIPGDGTDPAMSRAEDERAARRAQERIEMDRIARSLLRSANPTVFDDALLDSWRRRSNGSSGR